MAGITAACANDLQNIGAISCTKNNPFLDVVSLIVLKAGTTFATFVEFATESKHTDLIKAKKMIPIHEVFEIDDKSEEALYYESPTGKRLPRRLGNYRHIYKFDKSFEVHKALQSFRNANVDIMLVDSAGIISAWSPDGTKVRGFSVAMFNPEKMTRALPDNTPAWTPIAVDEADSNEWNTKGVSILPGWSATLLQPVTSVKVTVVSAIATLIVLKVAYLDGIDGDGAVNAVGIAGILQGDFVFTTTAPTAVVMVDNSDGTYNFPGAGMVSGSVTLKTPALAATTGDPIESTGPAVITIV